MTNAPRKKLPLRRRILFALVPLLGVLVSAEVLIRVFRAPFHFGSFRELRLDLLKRNYPAELHPTLGYVPRPNFASRDNHWQTMVTIDADGLRTNGRTPPPPGERCVLAVGDSFTFGDQVHDDESWPAQLEVALGQPVKNGGVFGYSMTQMILRAEMLLERLPVSTLIVCFIPDDLRRSEFQKRYTPLPWFESIDGELELRGVPIDHAAEALAARDPWKDLLGHSALLDAIFANTSREWWYENQKQVRVPQLVGKGPELSKLLLERVADECRARDVRLLVVMLQSNDDYALDVLRHAESKGIDTLDLATAYDALVAADPSVAERFVDGHMTAAGNDWIAERIAAHLTAH